MTAAVDSRRAAAEHTGGAALVAQQPPGELAASAPTTPAQAAERGSTPPVIHTGDTLTPHRHTGIEGIDGLGGSRFGVNRFDVNRFGVNRFDVNRFGVNRFGVNHDASAAGALAALAALDEAPRRSLAKGELLYHQGDAATTAYLVEAGLLALSIVARPGRERIVGLVGPGDVIGAHMLGQDRYLDSAGALGQDVRVAKLELAPEGHGALSPRLQALLSAAAYEHLERLTHQLEDAEVPVPARVARTFLRLAQRFGQASGSGAIRLTLPLTHDTLAAMVGAARETTSTTIEQLRRLGLVTGTRGRYLVQPEALGSFAHQAALA